MLDAVQFEDLGVPAAAILTAPFRATGLAMAALHGHADYPFATVPHPVTSLSKQEAAAVADAVTPRIERLLLACPTASAPTPASREHPSLDEIVESLAVGLRSDGANLTAELSGRRITFRLHIPDQACAECIMPSSMLAPVLQNRIDAELGPGWTVEIDDSRDSLASA